MDSEMKQLQRNLASKIERVKDAEKQSSRLQKENFFLQVQNGSFRKEILLMRQYCKHEDIERVNQEMVKLGLIKTQF